MGLVQQTRAPGRTTLLDAVNICLENIGEQPVDSLENEQIQDARVAERTLLEVHKQEQVRGWSWNKEYAYPFSRDSLGQIRVPETVVEFSPNPYEWNGRFQLRGSRVYDLLNRTYQMDPTINQITADVVWMLSWDDVPEAFNRFVTIRAARVFSDRTLGSEALFKYTLKDEQDAQALLMQMELTQESPNMLTGNYSFPTYQPSNGLMNRRVSTGSSIF
jgi:hypothetical protein